MITCFEICHTHRMDCRHARTGGDCTLCAIKFCKTLFKGMYGWIGYSESTYCPRFSLKILLLHQLHFHRQMMRSGKSVRYARPHGCDRDQCVLPKWLKHIHFLRKNQMIGTCVYSQKDCPIQKTDFILLVLIVLVKVKSKKVQYSLHQWMSNVNFSLKHRYINT